MFVQTEAQKLVFEGFLYRCLYAAVIDINATAQITVYSLENPYKPLLGKPKPDQPLNPSVSGLARCYLNSKPGLPLGDSGMSLSVAIDISEILKVFLVAHMF